MKVLINGEVLTIKERIDYLYDLEEVYQQLGSPKGKSPTQLGFTDYDINQTDVLMYLGKVHPEFEDKVFSTFSKLGKGETTNSICITDDFVRRWKKSYSRLQKCIGENIIKSTFSMTGDVEDHIDKLFSEGRVDLLQAQMKTMEEWASVVMVRLESDEEYGDFESGFVKWWDMEINWNNYG